MLAENSSSGKMPALYWSMISGTVDMRSGQRGWVVECLSSLIKWRFCGNERITSKGHNISAVDLFGFLSNFINKNILCICLVLVIVRLK